MLTVVADVHDRPSGVPRLLASHGVYVEVQPLRVGDYVVAQGAIVERKTVRGMHAAIIAGKFWPQIGRLREGATFPYLLVEGVDLDDGPLAPAAIRGACIAVTDLGVTLLRSQDRADSALWLYRLAVRRNAVRFRNRPAYAQRPKRDAGLAAAEAALSCVPGISRVSARALQQFGTLGRVVTAKEHEWQLVDGIGPRRAAALATTIHTRASPSHSSDQEEWRAPRPAT